MTNTLTLAMFENAARMGPGRISRQELQELLSPETYKRLAKAVQLSKMLDLLNFNGAVVERNLWQAHGPRMALALLDLWRK